MSAQVFTAYVVRFLNNGECTRLASVEQIVVNGSLVGRSFSEFMSTSRLPCSVGSQHESVGIVYNLDMFKDATEALHESMQVSWKSIGRSFACDSSMSARGQRRRKAVLMQGDNCRTVQGNTG